MKPTAESSMVCGSAKIQRRRTSIWWSMPTWRYCFSSIARSQRLIGLPVMAIAEDSKILADFYR